MLAGRQIMDSIHYLNQGIKWGMKIIAPIIPAERDVNSTAAAIISLMIETYSCRRGSRRSAKRSKAVFKISIVRTMVIRTIIMIISRVLNGNQNMKMTTRQLMIT